MEFEIKLQGWDGLTEQLSGCIGFLKRAEEEIRELSDWQRRYAGREPEIVSKELKKTESELCEQIYLLRAMETALFKVRRIYTGTETAALSAGETVVKPFAERTGLMRLERLKFADAVLETEGDMS